MSEMIRFIKLSRYSFKFRTNVIFLLLFFGIGVLNEVVTGGTQYLGAFYIVLSSMYMFQFIMSLAMSDMIQSSGIGRRIHLDIPVKLNLVLSLIFYTLVVVFRLSMSALHPEKAVDIASSLMVIDVMVLIIFIYAAVVFKYFLSSIIAFCLLFSCVIGGTRIIMTLPGVFVTMKAAVITGYAAILIGSAMQYLICRTLLKKPIAQRAFRGIFKDAK